MSENQKKRMPIWFKSVCWLAVISLIAVIGGILFTETWVDVVEDQLEELKTGDIEKAYYQYTSKDFQSNIPFDQFKAFTAAHPVLFQNPNAHFNNRGIHRNVSILRGKLTTLDHSIVPIEYKLIREDNDWKILSIRFMDHEADLFADDE